MVTQPQKDTPFGLEPNVAAGLAYLFSWVGGLIMLVGGGSNKFVKWAAAQSITLAIVAIAAYFVLWILIFVLSMAHMWAITPIFALLYFVVWVGYLVAWLWATIAAFTGKEVRLPIVAGFTESIFKTSL